MARTRRDKEIPGLWFFTDPIRTPDPVAIAARLPKGAVVVYRAFGAEEAEITAMALRRITRARGLKLLIGADQDLAIKVKADGVHMPERLACEIGRLQRGHPGWLISASAHSHRALHRAGGADAVVLSAVFPSRSPSAGPALGVVRLAALVHSVRAPIIALGGVNKRNAPRLLGAGAVGLAAIDGILAAD